MDATHNILRCATMRNKILALLFACTGSLAFTGPTFAWQSRLEGDPGVTDSSALGYYVWRDNDGLHVRTHGPGAEHVFSAQFHTDGVIRNVSPVRLESDDQNYLENGGHDLGYLLPHLRWDRWRELRHRRRHRADRIMTRLTRISTSDIFLGASGENPLHNPFDLPR